MPRPTDSPLQPLWEVLRLTREEELDCARFVELLPEIVDGRIDDATLRALVEHHRQICPECEEQYAILKRALGDEPSDPENAE